jgi:hypothetical protein
MKRKTDGKSRYARNGAILGLRKREHASGIAFTETEQAFRRGVRIR